MDLYRNKLCHTPESPSPFIAGTSSPDPRMVVSPPSTPVNINLYETIKTHSILVSVAKINY